MKRIIVETSEGKKYALDTALKKYGLTLTDWFKDKVDEIVEDSYDYYNRNPKDLTELSAIRDSATALDSLKSTDWSFTSEETGYLSHNIHPYPAKYIPQIPNNLIRLLSLPGEKVWDPFGGSGTTALEALLLGRQAISTDINPITEIIGKAKCTTITNEEESLILMFGEQMKFLSTSYDSFNEQYKLNKADIIKECPIIPNKEKWFQNGVWKELSFLKWKINNIENGTIKIFCRAIISKIIVRVSNQDSETRYVSKNKSLETGIVFKLFASEIEAIIPKIKKLGALLRFREATFITTDLRIESKQPNNSIDLIVTSPPYPNATDYHLYHRFRIFWLGFDPVELGKCEIGSHLRHQKENNGIEKYLEEMKMCLENMHKALRPGRYAVLVLGDAIFENTEYNTSELVGKIGCEVGFEIVGIFNRELPLNKRSFISAARRLKEENFLVLRKREIVDTFLLKKPLYKLWPYEEEIRILEAKSLLGVKRISAKGQNLEVKIDSMKSDLLKRLTFTHSFEGKEYSNEPTWQAVLENGEATESVSKRKDPKYATHGIHQYKGKFYPQLAKSLFNIAKLKPGNTVLDPFCGSGTVVLEGYLNGLNASGLDINPMALKIATAKTEILKIDPYLVDKLLSRFISKIEKIEPIKEYENYFDAYAIEELESWFPIKVLEKLAPISIEIAEMPNIQVKAFVEVCLSSIIRDISQQDPLDLRIRRRDVPIENAPVKELFLKRLIEQRKRLRIFAERSNKANGFVGTSKIMEVDARLIRSIDHNLLNQESIDCIVTSPPYATALPYIDTDRLSILLLFSMLSKERKTIEDNLVGARDIAKSNRQLIEDKIQTNDFGLIGSRSATEIIKKVHKLNKDSDVGFRKKNMASLLYRYYEDMSNIMRNLDWLIKKGGSLFFVIGDNKTYAGNKDVEVLIKSSRSLFEIGVELGWSHIKTIPITVTQENRLHNTNSILNNDIIWFKRL